MANQRQNQTQSDESATEREYEDSPTAPFNRKTERPLGSKTNQQPPESREDEIEKEKQYYHGGKRP